MKAIQPAIESTNVLFLEQTGLCAGFWVSFSRIKPASLKSVSGFQKRGSALSRQQSAFSPLGYLG